MIPSEETNSADSARETGSFGVFRGAHGVGGPDVALALLALGVCLVCSLYLRLEMHRELPLELITTGSAGAVANGLSTGGLTPDAAHRLEVALVASLCLAFWTVATFVSLFVRPRDVRWALLTLTAYDTAIWLAAGTASSLDRLAASELFHVALWLFLPLCVHLHLVLPEPILRGPSRRVVPAFVYLATFGVIALDLGGYLPPSAIVWPIGLAVALSLGILLVGLHRSEAPSFHFARRGMIFGLLFGLGPTLMAALLVRIPGLEESTAAPMGLRVMLLMAAPIWPIACVYALARRPAGILELRANRFLGLYGYLLLCLSIFVLCLRLGQATGLVALSPTGFALGVALLFALIAPTLRRRFQRFADRILVGLETPPERLVATFAESLPKITDPETLGRCLAREILPALLVRQSALYTFSDDGPLAIYEDTVPRPPTEAGLRQLLGAPARRLRDGDPKPDGFQWVRLVLPLVHEERILGIWLFGRRDPDDLYTRADVHTLEQLASQAVALLHAQLETREKENLREMLVHSQKMEAVGRLSAAVAHDFNNLLAIIELNSGFLLQRVEAPKLRRYVEGITGAAERASTLTRELLTFSRQRVVRPRRMDLNRLLRRMEPLVESSVGDGVELVFFLDPLLPPIEADPGRLEQVILNLAVNARDAMPEGGSLHLETGLAAGPAHSRGEDDQWPSQHAILRVVDTGAGIPKHVRSQIFEPFFTTKGRGHGTGLGLAITYGVLRQSGGDVEVTSTPGEGTTFTLRLPLATERSDMAESSVTIPAPPPRGEGTILLVEDEDFLRDALSEALSDEGFTVIVSADGLAALDIVERHQDRIDLLLTDVVMPRLGGPELAARASKKRPGLRVLYISGYDDGLIDAATADEFPLLRKPFSGETLCRRVREILESPAVPMTPGSPAEKAATEMSAPSGVRPGSEESAESGDQISSSVRQY